MDRKEILRELLALYDDKGPGNYYPADGLTCYHRGDESYGVALNQLLAEGAIMETEIDPSKSWLSL